MIVPHVVEPVLISLVYELTHVEGSASVMVELIPSATFALIVSASSVQTIRPVMHHSVKTQEMHSLMLLTYVNVKTSSVVPIKMRLVELALQTVKPAKQA